ncbi:hypothetical protein OROHE_014496 [Orobanche hederae]
MRVLMSTQMPEGTPVRDHVLKMISHLNELDILGSTIDAETQVDIILGSLPRSFEQFCLSYNMNHREYTLAELLTELQATEGIFRQGYQVLAATSVSTSKPKWGKRKKQVGQKKVGALKVKSKAPQPEVNKKPKGKCFKCGRKGHFKADCPALKKVTKRLSAGEITINWGDYSRLVAVAVGVVQLKINDRILLLLLLRRTQLCNNN